MAKKKFYAFKALENNEGELTIYGEIISSEGWWSDGSEVTPKGFKEELDALGDISVLNVYINSPGGDVFAGQAIYSMLKRNKATINVYIDGLAASIASVIAMAADTLHMPSNSMMMIHNPWSCAQGNSKDFRKMADDLDKIGLSIQETYLSKATDMKQEDLVNLLDAETWLTAKECLDLGLCNVVDEEKVIAASLNDFKILDNYKNTPKFIKIKNDSNKTGPACTDCKATDCGTCPCCNCTQNNCDNCNKTSQNPNMKLDKNKILKQRLELELQL